jgi:Ca-activated chloride channel family protein
MMLHLAYGASVLSFWIGVGVLIVALASPALVERERIFANRGIDIMIVLDESPSMATRDFQPGNRFETARSVIRRFVAQRENDPIGLASFGKEAALRVPPTLDYNAVLAGLADLQLMGLGDGTAIGMGIAVAGLHLSDSSAGQKVVILLTDGKNNAGEVLPETAAQVAREMGIRIYAIGIGSQEEAPFELRVPETGEMLRGTYRGGFDEELLRSIAEITGGTYFSAASAGTLQSVFEAIDSMETVERRVRVEVNATPMHRVFIMIGLALILFDFVVRKLFLRELL